MSARKRSGALTLSGMAAVVLLSGCSHGSGSTSTSSPRASSSAQSGHDFGRYKPVAVLGSDKARQKGVHEFPLRPGQSLAFVWPVATSPTWTMAHVRYPLRLVALSPNGHKLGSRSMAACPNPATDFDCLTALPVTAATWLEVRPRHPARGYKRQKTAQNTN